jgi:hypothetical protein
MRCSTPIFALSLLSGVWASDLSASENFVYDAIYGEEGSLSFRKISTLNGKIVENILLKPNRGSLKLPENGEYPAFIFYKFDNIPLEPGRENPRVDYSLNDRGEDAILIACSLDERIHIGSFYTEDPAIVRSSEPLEFYRLCEAMYTTAILAGAQFQE